MTATTTRCVFFSFAALAHSPLAPHPSPHPHPHRRLSTKKKKKKKLSTEHHQLDQDQALRHQKGPLRRVRPRCGLGLGPRELEPGRVAGGPALVRGRRLDRRAPARRRGGGRVQIRRRPRRGDRGVGGRGQPRADCCCRWFGSRRCSVGRDRSAQVAVGVGVIIVVKVEARGSEGPGSRGLRAFPSGHARRRTRGRRRFLLEAAFLGGSGGRSGGRGDPHGPGRRGVGRRRDQVRPFFLLPFFFFTTFFFPTQTQTDLFFFP